MTSDECSDRLVIGLTGPLGSGVTTLSQALAANDFERVSMSEPIKKELRKRENLREDSTVNEKIVKDCRKKLQDIGNEYRKNDPGYWAKKAIKEIKSLNKNKDVVVDGIRNKAEVDEFRQEYSTKFFLIGVHASIELRRQRLVNSNYDGNLKNFNRDDERDTNENLDIGQQVERCVHESDYIVVNDKNESSKSRSKNLFDNLKDNLKLMRNIDKPNTHKDLQRAPTRDETQMATAYAQSHASECLKRHVGAVIVDKDGRALSLGYNENPIVMKPCRTLYKYCFKDDDMDKKLEKMEGIHCPECGKEFKNLQDPWLCPNKKCQANLKNHFFPDRNMVLCTAIHAEERAIRSLGGRSAAGGTIYSTTCPCFQCARYIVDAEIKRVVYVEAYPIKESIEFLRTNNVMVEPFWGFKARAFNLIFKQVE